MPIHHPEHIPESNPVEYKIGVCDVCGEDMTMYGYDLSAKFVLTDVAICAPCKVAVELEKRRQLAARYLDRS